MVEAYTGQIKIFAGNFAPRGWAFCDGQLLAIGDNEALFSLLGTTYGGDGETTFALPDLRGRIPFHVGNGMNLGERAGEETHSLTTQEMPGHDHILRSSPVQGNTVDPAGNFLAESPVGDIQYTSEAPNGDMSSSSIANTGSGQTHNNLPPYLVVSFVIALQGLFPPRN